MYIYSFSDSECFTYITTLISTTLGDSDYYSHLQEGKQSMENLSHLSKVTG